MSRPLRVLEIISGFAVEGPLGGIERFGIELARALPAENVQPIVCGMWSYGTEGEKQWLAALQAEGIEAFISAGWQAASPYHAFLHSLKGTKEQLAGQQVDVIHSHCQFGDALALLLRRQLGAKAVVRTVHNEREWIKRPLRRLLFTNFLAPLLLQKEMGVSQQVVENLNRRAVARLSRRQALLSYNSINLERFEQPIPPQVIAARRAALGLPADAILIGSIGRLEPQKGYPHLLDAMEEVVQRIPRAHLLLAGEGTLASQLQAQATASPVADHLHLVGPQREIEQLYAMLNLFVSSSLWEGLPTVLLEAMAAGVPVVATKVSGSTELVQDGVTGRLVSPDNASALSQAIVAALSEHEATGRMVEVAHKSLRPFDIRNAARTHAHLYRSLVNGEGSLERVVTNRSTKRTIR
jgi:glycosyltransferase involved in cell wall biosynthesis